MTVWMVRAGAHGEREDLALENGLAVIGWGGLPDLSPINSREELDSLCRETLSESKSKSIINWVGQLWAFRSRIQPGDLVALPLKMRSAIAIGKVTGPYQYRPDLPEEAHHTRPVDWIRKDIPRSAFGQDILYSLGALQTVCQIRRNNAEERIRAILEGQPDPGVVQRLTEELEAGEEAPLNLDEYAQDQIRSYIGRGFKGHALARLVAALLTAQGYHVQMSPEGPDGGVDIIAGQGPMGFDSPRLCVQVKSSDSPVGVRVLRELQGVMRNFGAEQGLLVSWGGFKESVYRESRRLFFQIRLWDAGDLVQALLRHYDKLPDDLQAELPLKRIWTLVLEG